jgi:hypothetical protein
MASINISVLLMASINISVLLMASINISVLLMASINISVGARRVRPPLKLKKDMIFWRKIVILHTKYPKNFRASLRSAQFF